VVLLTADHGPAVSGAHNSIIASRAGKDLISSLVSGLLTIGPRFGGAVQGSADHFTHYLYEGHEPGYMVKNMKSKNVNIQGIGHRIKSVTNPDVRVEIMVDFAKKKFPITETLDYALKVEKLTTAKRNNLILNVDGCIGVLSCDMLRGIGYSREEVREFVDLGILNAFFVLGRSIGFMGHIMDQKRLKSRLYRHPWDDINYMMPDKPKKIR
jgi:citrate synthase